MGSSTLIAAPEQVDFGSREFGSFESRTLLITNAGPDSVVLDDVVMMGDVGPFEFTGGSCEPGALVAAGGSCDLEVTFSPIEFELAVHAVDLIVSGDDEAEPAIAQLVATTLAFAPLSVTPGTVDSPLVADGTTGPPRHVNVLNRTGSTLTLDFPTVSGPFWISGWTCGGQLAPEASCSVSVHLTPPAGTPAGAHSGRLTVRTEGYSASVSLTGTVANMPPRTPRGSTRSSWPVETRLGKLAEAVPGLVRGARSRSRLLPAFEAGAAGRLSVALFGWNKSRRLRIGGGWIVFDVAERGRMSLGLNKRGIALLRRPQRTRIEVVAKFEPRVGSSSRQGSEFVVKAPAKKRKRR